MAAKKTQNKAAKKIDVFRVMIQIIIWQVILLAIGASCFLGAKAGIFIAGLTSPDATTPAAGDGPTDPPCKPTTEPGVVALIPGPDRAAGDPTRLTWYPNVDNPVTPPGDLDRLRFLMMIAEPFRFHDRPGRPLTEGTLLTRIRVAQQIIASTNDPPDGFWEWERVKRTVALFGTDIPIIEDPSSGSTLMSHSSRDGDRSVLRVYSRNLREISDGRIQEVLVHEATHAVFSQLTRERTGYSAHDLSSIEYLCRDLVRAHAFVTEAAAFSNGAAWTYRTQPPPLPPNLTVARFTLMLSARTAELVRQHNRWPEDRLMNEVAYLSNRGDVIAQSIFAGTIRDYADEEVADTIHANRSSPRTCGPLPIIRGPRSGTWYHQTDIARHIVPLWEEMQAIERSRH